MIAKVFRWVNEHFWLIIALLSVVHLIINWFNHSMEIEEEVLNDLTLLIALLAMDIKRWLGK